MMSHTAHPAAARLLDLHEKLEALRRQYSQQIIEAAALKRDVAELRAVLVARARSLANLNGPKRRTPQAVDLQGNVTGGVETLPVEVADPTLAARITAAEPAALIEAGVPSLDVARFTTKQAQLQRAVTRVAEVGAQTRATADYYDKATRAAWKLGIRV